MVLGYKVSYTEGVKNENSKSFFGNLFLLKSDYSGGYMAAADALHFSSSSKRVNTDGIKDGVTFNISTDELLIQ